MNLHTGVRLRFLLVANPIKTIADERARLKGKVKRCRIPLIKEDEQSKWLKRKLADAAVVNLLEVEKLLPLHFRKGGTPGKIQPYCFKGIIEIEDADLLMTLIQKGIGPAKAFGCGLLSLAAT